MTSLRLEGSLPSKSRLFAIKEIHVNVKTKSALDLQSLLHDLLSSSDADGLILHTCPSAAQLCHCELRADSRTHLVVQPKPRKSMTNVVLDHGCTSG